MQKPRRQRRRKVNRERPAVPNRSPRAALWIVALLMAPLMGYFVWRTSSAPTTSVAPSITPSNEVARVDTSRDKRSDRDESGSTESEKAAEEVKKSKPVSPADASVSQGLAARDASPRPTTTSDVSMVKAPGASQTSYVAPLADAYRRIDPVADGWETEAFHESSSKQLEKLNNLFVASLDDELAATLAVDQFACADLHPDGMQDVFQDDALHVQRASAMDNNPSNATDTSMPSFRGPQGLLAAIQQFRQLYVGGKIERVKLKPFRVAKRDDGHVATTLYFQSFGKVESGSLQVNATWNLTWVSEGDRLPMLLSIQLEAYETVHYRGTDDQLFSDCTKSVLGETDAYNKQFLWSTDHWRARLPRDLGLDVVGNHGLAVGDVNGDHLDDLYVCQQGGLPNRLFLQNPDGTLRDGTAESGADWLDYCASALLVDFDNDGDRDLAVAQEWRILMMSNDGQGHFQLEFGTSTEAQSYSLAAADYDRDGDVDVYVCGYNPTASTLRRGAMGEPMPYHDANNGGRNMLLRNDGNWLYTDVTADVGLNENNTRFSFAAAWEDYDNDGDPDLYVANDYGRNNLYKNNDGQFDDIAAELNVEDMSSGMSANWGDFNRDGWMDLYVSNMFSAAGNRITYQRQFKSDADATVREQYQRLARGNTLFLNTQGGFRDVSEDAGVTMGRWSWGSRFADINGDGWQDLLVANGFITTEDSGDL